MKITKAYSRKVLNSNSNYTIEVVIISRGVVFRGSAPAGESTSKYEVGGFSQGIDATVADFNKLLAGLKGKDISSLEDVIKIENTLPKQFIGAPSLSLSYALLQLASFSSKKEVYQLFTNKIKPVMPISKIIGGGVHALGRGPDIQEILVTTLDNNPINSIQTTLQVYKRAKEILADYTASFSGGVDPEGGFVSGLDNYESLKVVRKAVEEVIRYTGADIRMGIDFAASTLYKNGKYIYNRPLYNKRELTRGEQIDLILQLAKEFDLYYIEDPVDEDDPQGYKEIKEKLPNSIIIADDLTATNPARLLRYKSSISGALIKPNQQGLISISLAFSKLLDKLNLIKVVSHRSEETNDSILSDLAIGLGADLMKIGINRGERIAKINRLIEIWEGK